MTLSRPRRVEIVGVAGAGKSTLTRALGERYAACRVADSLHTRLPTHWPYVVHSLPRVLPVVVRTARHRPMMSWEELKFVIYISEWNRFIRAHARNESWVTVLDQGPIFALARLLWGSKPVTRCEWFQAWLTEMVERWSLELDLIVVLLASDDVLLERINHRDSAHAAKGASAQDALGLIESHRMAYARVLELVDRLGRPRVLRFDSSTTSADAIADQLGEIFERSSTQAVDEWTTGLQPETGEESAHEHV